MWSERCKNLYESTHGLTVSVYMWYRVQLQFHVKPKPVSQCGLHSTINSHKWLAAASARWDMNEESGNRLVMAVTSLSLFPVTPTL